MADDQFQASGNWWESARNVRFESGESQSSSSGLTNFGGWQQQQHHHHDNTISASVSNSSVVFHDSQKLQPPDSAATSATNDPNLHMMMGLGLSSRAMDWNQASLL